jgi:hypothetical protein
MPDDVELFSDKEKDEYAYRYCVGGMVATGATLGSIAGGQTIEGAAGGLIWGLLTCKKVSIIVRKKLFSSNQKLSDHEIATLLGVIKSKKPYLEKGNALKMLASIRSEVGRNPSKYKRMLG